MALLRPSRSFGLPKTIVRAFLLLQLLPRNDSLCLSSYALVSEAPDYQDPTALLEARGNGDEEIGMPTCMLPLHAKRDVLETGPVTALSPRAPKGKGKATSIDRQPLREPKDDSDRAFAEFIERHQDRYTQLNIFPGETQKETWKITYGQGRRAVDIPIGATGNWHPFTNEKDTFVLQGLTGCTAIIIVSSKGIYAAHLWEGSKAAHGASSFRETIREKKQGNDPGAFRTRPVPEFKAIAVDIFGQRTPANERKARRAWKSLIDLERDNGDPFRRKDDVEVFLLTKAESDNAKKPTYDGSIAELRKMLVGDPGPHQPAGLLRGASYRLGLYNAHEASRVPVETRGMIVVQYSPYDHDSSDKSCTPEARVRVFYENHKRPVIDKSWPAPWSQRKLRRRRDGDACVIQKESEWPIKEGYVAFGDSFAAGLGTGVTSTDSCRVGTANVGDLVHGYTNDTSVDFQKKMCSGDTLSGLDRQINDWTDSEKADVATLTIGANDVGLTDVVMNCVLVPAPFHGSVSWKQKCEKTMDKAKSVLSKTSDDGIDQKLSDAYKKILDKSEKDDFHLYVAGYPGGFFNAADIKSTDCNHTAFNYWRATYCPHTYQACHSKDNVYLTVGLREKLDGIVDDLNDKISKAVDKVNGDDSEPRVHYVDVSPYFDNHRWCERNSNSDWHEPNPDRADTWFFLSGWKDVGPLGFLRSLGGLSNGFGSWQNATDDANEARSLVDSGEKIELPAANSCEDDLGTDPDPWVKWKCMVAQSADEEPDGRWATTLDRANDEIMAKNYSGQSIRRFTPTRQLKTFHPRTPGMIAYRDSIVDAIREHQMGIPSAKAGPSAGMPTAVSGGPTAFPTST